MIIIAEVYPGSIVLSRFADDRLVGKSLTLSVDARMSSVAQDVRDSVSALAEKDSVEAIVLYSPWGSLSSRRFLPLDRGALTKLRGLTEIFPFYMPFFMSVLQAFEEAVPNVGQYVFLGNSFFNSVYRRSIRYAVAEPFVSSVRTRCQGRHGLFHEYHARSIKETGKLVSVVFDTQTTVCGMYKGTPRTISTGGTPLEGVMGRTSCGDVDPGIPFYLMQQGYSVYAVDEMLKKQSGFRGLCGFDGPLEELFRLYGIDNDVTLAVDVFLTHMLKYIGEAMAIIGGMDTLVFGGPRITEFTPLMHMIAARLSFLGLRLDTQHLAADKKGCCRVSTQESVIPVCVVNDTVATMISCFYQTDIAASIEEPVG
jgi:acetate kinase